MGKLLLLLYCLLLPFSVLVLILVLSHLFDHLIAVDHRITLHLIQQEEGKKEMIDSIWTLGAETAVRVSDSDTVGATEQLQLPASALSVSRDRCQRHCIPHSSLYLPTPESSLWPQRPCRCRHPSPSHRLELASQPGAAGTQTAKTPPHQRWREACRRIPGPEVPYVWDLSAPESLSAGQFASTGFFSSFRGLVYWTADDTDLAHYWRWPDYQYHL